MGREIVRLIVLDNVSCAPGTFRASFGCRLTGPCSQVSSRILETGHLQLMMENLFAVSRHRGLFFPGAQTYL